MTYSSYLFPLHVLSSSDVERACKAATKLLLFLDYDGTLLPLATRPEDAQPPVAVLTLLSQLTQNPKVEVVIISGRPVKELHMLLPLPGLSYIGTHGGEILTEAGERQQLTPPWRILSHYVQPTTEIPNHKD